MLPVIGEMTRKSSIKIVEGYVCVYCKKEEEA
jgi:hypothetical protein